MPAPSSCLRNASTASIVGSTTVLLLSESLQISLRMTRWSSHSTTFRRSFVHHVRGRYFRLVTCGFRRSATGFYPCLHLESVLGADLATCGDGRIWLLPCEFDAPAVPVVS